MNGMLLCFPCVFVNSCFHIFHILIYGLKICQINGEICIKVNSRQNNDADHLHQMLCSWQEQAGKLRAGEITKDEYDNWRYHYHKLDSTQIRANVLSEELSDMILNALKDGDE